MQIYNVLNLFVRLARCERQYVPVQVVFYFQRAYVVEIQGDILFVCGPRQGLLVGKPSFVVYYPLVARLVGDEQQVRVRFAVLGLFLPQAR